MYNSGNVGNPNTMNYGPSGYNPNFNSNYGQAQPQPQVVIVQQPPVGHMCPICGGSGVSINKKGKSKTCKHCKGIGQSGPHLMPHRRKWFGCLKINKKGEHKCKVAKGCSIL
jgi:hypothetical protein